VIARRGLGLWDEVPKNYRKLLDDREYLQYALFRWKALREELDGRLEAESNPWKKNCLRAEIRKASREIKALKRRLKGLKGGSPGSNLVLPQEANRGKKPPRGRSSDLQQGWRVLRTAVVVPLLGESFAKDYSPLKAVLVSGAWERATGPPASVPGAGATHISLNVRFG